MSKVLLVVDYQNDFVSGALGFKDAEKLEDGITEKIKEYASNCDYVICTMDTHGSNYLSTQEGRNLPIEHCIKGTKGWEMYGKTKKAAYEAAAIIVEKETFGANQLFSDLTRVDNLERKISNKGILEVEVCGVVTNMCVISNAVIAKAALPEAKITILSDLCSSFDLEMHKQALNVMSSMQMEVI